MISVISFSSSSSLSNCLCISSSLRLSFCPWELSNPVVRDDDSGYEWHSIWTVTANLVAQSGLSTVRLSMLSIKVETSHIKGHSIPLCRVGYCISSFNSHPLRRVILVWVMRMPPTKSQNLRTKSIRMSAPQPSTYSIISSFFLF